MWFRYKHKWASGIDIKWSYVEIDSSYVDKGKEGLHDFIEDYNLCDEHNWSDKYRGIDYDIIKAPPKEWLIKEIKKCRNRAIGWTKKSARLEIVVARLNKRKGKS